MKWICTDPSCKQYGRKIGERVFEFKEDVKFPNSPVVTVQKEIDLNDYTDEEINDYLSPYGWSIEILNNENDSNASAEWLMAECIFEQTLYE